MLQSGGNKYVFYLVLCYKNTEVKHRDERNKMKLWDGKELLGKIK